MSHQKTMTRLEKRLSESNSELFGLYSQVVKITRALMPRAYATFWQYTDHSLTHTHAVVQIIDRLCTDSVLESFSDQELFVLLAGATLHDIGMITPEPYQGTDADEARKGHDVIGAERINTNSTQYGVPLEYASAVATLIRHHRSSNIADDVVDSPVGFDMVRLRLLCALLRAGDELHLTEDRAPEVVINNLDLPDSSVEHFANCRAVTGVAVAGPGSEIIVLQATVKDEATEKGLIQVVSKVNEELEKLTPIFDQYQLPHYRLQPSLHRDLLILKKTLLELCRNSEGKTTSQISEIIHEDAGKTADAFRSLAAKRLIREVDSEEKAYAPIQSDITVFQEIAKEFLGTPNDLEFLKTDYATSTIPNVVLPWLCREYSCVYSKLENETRGDVLKHSPSAVSLALFSFDVGRKPSLISRRVLLDQLLLSGIMTDIYTRPEISVDLNVGRVVGELGRHVSQRVSSFARIISRAWTHRNTSIEEMGDRLLKRGDDGLPDALFPVRISLSVSGPSKPAYLSFPHLLMAAAEEMETIEIASPHLTSFVATHRDGSDAPAINNRVPTSPTLLTFSPGISSPAMPFPEMPCKFVLDEAAKTCVVKVDQSRLFTKNGSSFNDKYPARLYISDISQFPHCQILFKENFGPVSCGTLMEDLKLDRLLAARGHCSYTIENEDGNQIGTIEQKEDKRRYSLIQRKYFRAIEILANLEQQLGTNISAPDFLTSKQVEAIAQLNTGQLEANKKLISESIQAISRSEHMKWFRLRVTVLAEDGSTVVDSYPHKGVGEMEAHFTQGDGTEVTPTEKINKEGIQVEHWSNLSPRQIVDDLMDGLKTEKIKLPRFDANPEGPLVTEIAISISPFISTTWGEEQLVHITLKPLQTHRRSLFHARALVEEKDYERAKELLVEAIIAEPTLPVAHYNLGYVYFNMGQMDKAEVSLKNGASLPNKLTNKLTGDQTAWTHVLLGMIHLHRGNLDKSLEAYSEAQKLKLCFDAVSAVQDLENRQAMFLETSAYHYVAAWLSSSSNNYAKVVEHAKGFLEAKHDAYAKYEQNVRELLAKSEEELLKAK